ncbi:hypothetical protein B0A48_14953 [Cryoendolithus antarcticus]|uniref:Heterokaryon incompatibility domain-containing protein n=1 Tax=Cryoendolithus antarcticus TaxID=1507870 RepID=A0A1V8SIY1_9PEZI|nr:hypothetical protein B0A48_14953 [Cryoendolithus antarcticus]
MQAELASDKVYSLYGVNGFSGAFPPDYSQPCWWAYAQATYASISKYRDFSVLLNAKRITHLDAVPNLPTWAFDYSSGMYYSFPESVGEAMLATLRGAQPSLPRLSADHSTLYLSGLLRGEIDCTGRVTFNETEGDRKYSRSDFFRAFTNALNRQLIDPNAEDYLWPLSETRTHFTLDGQFLLDLRARRFIMEKCRISSPMPDDDDEWAQSINFFATAGGLSGIMPTSCAVGDYVFVTRYCPYPLILRQRDQGWVFQGCAYIPALLYGYVEIFSAYQVTTVGIM